MPPFFRLIAVMLIWALAGAISILQFFFAPLGSINLIFTVIIFGMALGGTGIILSDGKSANSRPMIEINKNSGRATTDKRKNDQAGGLTPDMLALLDEDDIEELRQRVKERLMERIEGGGDGELSSLDALLADQNTAPRKSRR